LQAGAQWEHRASIRDEARPGAAEWEHQEQSWTGRRERSHEWAAERAVPAFRAWLEHLEPLENSVVAELKAGAGGPREHRALKNRAWRSQLQQSQRHSRAFEALRQEEAAWGRSVKALQAPSSQQALAATDAQEC
jgi:hypothetical protein